MNGENDGFDDQVMGLLAEMHRVENDPGSYDAGIEEHDSMQIDGSVYNGSAVHGSVQHHPSMSLKRTFPFQRQIRIKPAMDSPKTNWMDNPSMLFRQMNLGIKPPMDNPRLHPRFNSMDNQVTASAR